MTQPTQTLLRKERDSVKLIYIVEVHSSVL